MTFHIFLFLFCRRKKNLARRRRRRRRVRRETPSESQQGSVLPLSLSFFRAAPRSKERGGGGRRGKGARKSETDNGEEERVKEAPSPLHAVAGPDRTEPNRTERLVCLSTSVCLFPPRSPYLYVCGRERCACASPSPSSPSRADAGSGVYVEKRGAGARVRVSAAL